MNKEVSNYLDNLKSWKEELTLLRKIALNCNLSEDFKWRNPCYTYQNKNILLLFSLKEYCGISFLKGVLLKDEKNVLVQQTYNMQSVRQLRFTSLSEIKENFIKSFIFDAIKVEKSGFKLPKKSVLEFDIPIELIEFFKKDINFKNAFYSLTPGRQKGYLLHFTQAKQSKTKLLRIEKYKQQILDGFGIRDCTCGLSKRKPNCDGSHKQLVS